jgi:hypothetical protein
VSLSDWLDKNAAATRLQACDVALARFRSEADGDSGYMLQVADAVWKLLTSATTPGEADPAALVSEIRAKLTTLGSRGLEQVASELLQATTACGQAQSEAGKLVACWFKAIALQQDTALPDGRVQHVVRSYEETFMSLRRLLDRERGRPRS